MDIGTFHLIKTEGQARRGEFCTAHGVVQTPVFQNVGTSGAIKGAVDAFDLNEDDNPYGLGSGDSMFDYNALFDDADDAGFGFGDDSDDN